MSTLIRFVIACFMLGAASAYSATDYTLETIASGLDHPWSLAFLPDGRMLVTERAGRLRVIEDGRLLPRAVEGVPEVYVRSQAGLFEVLADTDFATNQLIYLSFAHGDAGANHTRVIRARLDGMALHDVQVIFDALPAKRGPVHYGGRMVWLDDGSLVISVGDGFDYREQAQNPGNHLGTLVRIRADGSLPPDNPFLNQPDAQPEIYSYGHRNIQGLYFDTATGILWSHDHGPRGGDELNRILPARNYGWPITTHGVDYSGARVSPFTDYPGMVPPLLHWTPSIAPSGLTRYRGDAFPELDGALLATGLVSRAVHVVRIDDTGDATETGTLFSELDTRLRHVHAGPDGLLYLLTDEDDGRVIRISPAGGGVN